MTRTFWTFIMFGGFFTALFMGHIYIICIITAIQVVSFKEVIAIASVPSRARQLRPSKSLNWYWLATTMYYLYGESVIYYFKHIVLVDKVLLPLATHHRFISFLLYIFGTCCPLIIVPLALQSSWNLLLILSKALFSSSALSRLATTDSSSLSLPGRTWRSSLSWSKLTSS